VAHQPLLLVSVTLSPAAAALLEEKKLLGLSLVSYQYLGRDKLWTKPIMFPLNKPQTPSDDYSMSCLVHLKIKKITRFSVTSNIAAHAWTIKYGWKQKLIAQFICKSHDTNLLSLVTLWLDNVCQIKMESVIVSKSKNFLDLNRALVSSPLRGHLSLNMHKDKYHFIGTLSVQKKNILLAYIKKASYM